MARASSGLQYPERFYAAASYAGFDGSPRSSSKAVRSKFNSDSALLLYALHQQVLSSIPIAIDLFFDFNAVIICQYLFVFVILWFSNSICVFISDEIFGFYDFKDSILLNYGLLSLIWVDLEFRSSGRRIRFLILFFFWLLGEGWEEKQKWFRIEI